MGNGAHAALGPEDAAQGLRDAAPRRPGWLIASRVEAKSHHFSHDLLDFAAGIVGGVAGIAVGHPFDTVKVRLQSDTAKRFAGPADALRQTVRHEGAMGLFKGIETPILCSVPVQAIVFGVYGVSLRRIGQYTQEGLDPSDGLPSPDLQPIWHHFAAGTVTGAVQTPLLAASDYAKILMQNQTESKSIAKAQKASILAAKPMPAGTKVLYSNSVDAMVRVYQQHGLRTSFRGTTATLLRDITYGQYFGQYEWMKRELIGSRDDAVTKATACALAGGISGLTCWVLIYPLDAIKTRIQSVPAASPAVKIWPTFQQMAAEEPGFKAFTRGLGVTLTRAFPVNVVTFVMYEGALSCRCYLP
jgi:solute carrier family 25 carnitine/acylcarnitine transporter 20/29